MMGRHEWKKVDMSGGRWKAVDNVMFFIYYYTPVFTVNLVSKNRLSRRYPPDAIRCLIFILSIQILVS